MLFLTNVFPFVASFSALSLSDNNSLTACARLDGLLGGTIIPVSLFFINSGIPPTSVPITGMIR